MELDLLKRINHSYLQLLLTERSNNNIIAIKFVLLGPFCRLHLYSFTKIYYKLRYLLILKLIQLVNQEKYEQKIIMILYLYLLISWGNACLLMCNLIKIIL